MTLKELIAEALKENGFDGLYYSDMECGCDREYLFPCENPDFDNCTGGFKQMGDDGDWIIGPNKEEEIESGS